MNEFKIKKDKYLVKRGGTAHIIQVICAKCEAVLLLYQKDGPGWLKRCYLNRILEPKKFSQLQYDGKLNEPKDLPNLICECDNLIGVPMKHKDNRLAFRLERGSFKRKTKY